MPDLRNLNGWISTLYVRNNSAEPRSVQVHYFDQNGNPTPVGNDVCSLGPNQWCHIPVNDFDRVPVGTRASAVIDGGEDISVVVINDNGLQTDGYTVIPAVTSVSGIGTGNTTYIPAFFNNYYGWSSKLYVQNIGTSTTTVNAYMYNDNGIEVGSSAFSLNPNGSTTVSLSGVSFGSAKVTASQPLAVTVSHDNPTYAMSFVSEGVANHGTTAYFPNLFKNYYGWMSSFQVQEVTGNPVTVSVTYYPSGSYSFSLPARGHKEVYMGSQGFSDGWRGSAKISLSGSGGITTAVHHTNNSVMAGLGYHGLKAGAREVIAPYLFKKPSGGYGWISSLTMQNVGSVSTSVTVRFYNDDGTLRSTYPAFNLAPGNSRELQAEIPSGFIGSAVVQSSASDVVVSIHHAHDDGRHQGYSAP